jgi:hypothetical protein
MSCSRRNRKNRNKNDTTGKEETDNCKKEIELSATSSSDATKRKGGARKRKKRIESDIAEAKDCESSTSNILTALSHTTTNTDSNNNSDCDCDCNSNSNSDCNSNSNSDSDSSTATKKRNRSKKDSSIASPILSPQLDEIIDRQSPATHITLSQTPSLGTTIPSYSKEASNSAVCISMAPKQIKIDTSNGGVNVGEDIAIVSSSSHKKFDFHLKEEESKAKVNNELKDDKEHVEVKKSHSMERRRPRGQSDVTKCPICFKGFNRAVSKLSFL